MPAAEPIGKDDDIVAALVEMAVGLVDEVSFWSRNPALQREIVHLENVMIHGGSSEYLT